MGAQGRPAGGGRASGENRKTPPILREGVREQVETQGVGGGGGRRAETGKPSKFPNGVYTHQEGTKGVYSF